MDFVKKEWQFRDIISENELNRMEDGIEEGITKAEQAQQIANEARDTADAAQSDLSAHASATTGVHGATSAAAPNTLMQRDAAGRAKVAAPSASDDIARKDTVDGAISAHVAATDPHTQYTRKTININGQDLNNIIETGFYDGQNLINAPISGWLYIAVIRHTNDTSTNRWVEQIAYDFNANRIWVRQSRGSTGIWTSWTPVWTADSDGAGSGLDADLLDGKDSSDFVQAPGGMSVSISGIDLNNLTNTGFYHGQNLTNAPLASTDWYWVQVIRHGANDYVIQKAWHYFSNREFMRARRAGTWQPWVEMWHAGNQPQLRLNNGVLEYWDGTQWKQAGGVRAASGTGTTDGSAVLTVGGLSFQPAYILVSQEIYNGGGYNQYLRVYSVGGEWFNNYRMRNITNGGPDDVIETSGFTITANGFSCAMVEANKSAKWYAFGSIA